jgi:hypothetical protein
MKLFGKTVALSGKPVNDDNIGAKLLKERISPLIEDAVMNLCAAIKTTNLSSITPAVVALSTDSPALIRIIEVILSDGTRIGISVDGVPMGLTLTDFNFSYSDTFRLI